MGASPATDPETCRELANPGSERQTGVIASIVRNLEFPEFQTSKPSSSATETSPDARSSQLPSSRNSRTCQRAGLYGVQCSGSDAGRNCDSTATALLLQDGLCGTLILSVDANHELHSSSTETVSKPYEVSFLQNESLTCERMTCLRQP